MLTAIDEQLAEESSWDFTDLRALYINCTLKRSPEASHTQGLGDRSIAILERNGVAVEVIRAVDHDIATGVYPDMTDAAGSETNGRRSSRRCWRPTSSSCSRRSGWARSHRCAPG